jgi:hypothetical protein
VVASVFLRAGIKGAVLAGGAWRCFSRNPVVQVQSPLQSGKGGQKGVSETVDGAGLVTDQVPAASEEGLQLGQFVLAGGELLEVWPHTGLIGDDVGVSGVGLGLSGVDGGELRFVPPAAIWIYAV